METLSTLNHNVEFQNSIKSYEIMEIIAMQSCMHKKKYNNKNQMPKYQ